MKKLNKFIACVIALMFLAISLLRAQPRVMVYNGKISLKSGTLAPVEKDFAGSADSLDKNLKIHPNDTTSLFFRALIYLQFNSFVMNPDPGSSQATNKLLLAKSMADRADSLNMKNFYLKVLQAQLCSELVTRNAPIETWRFNEKQMAERRKKHDYYKELANHYYDIAALIDKNNAYAYHRLKINE
ncbi:hypothetical protein [Mucilaginibacter sp. UYCu711]|uniref:hypothetical protein n=1 Tax=Mucilaginibacter sp. UYCu711 TaxID=3156339 RepID=UPI003D22E3C3